MKTSSQTRAFAITPHTTIALAVMMSLPMALMQAYDDGTAIIHTANAGREIKSLAGDGTEGNADGGDDGLSFDRGPVLATGGTRFPLDRSRATGRAGLISPTE